MDIALARTFLEIVASGSFLRAAERLHLTQTAVSARVRTLEVSVRPGFLQVPHWPESWCHLSRCCLDGVGR